MGRAVPRTNDPQGTRSRILDAAADLFQSHGYHETAMQQIIKTAEVTSGALHHHFASKKDLGLAVIDERVAKAVRETWIAPVLAAADPIKGIGTAFRSIGRELKSQGFVRGCPLNNLAIELAYADPDFGQAVSGVFNEWRGALADALVTKASGSRRSRAEAADLATLVIATYSGAMAMSKAEQSAKPLESAWRVLSKNLG